MIYAVTESTEREVSFCENPFPGMNLSEACAELQVNVNNIINEMNMEILLDEHKYLYENGTEVEYVNEAGESTTEGNKLWDKIKSKLQIVWDHIQEMWDKIAEWVVNHVEAINTALVNAGIAKRDLQKAIDGVEPGFTFKVPAGDYVSNNNWNEFIGIITDPSKVSFIHSDEIDENADNNVLRFITKRDDIEADAESVSNAQKAILDSKGFMKQIRTVKGVANKTLRELMKATKHSPDDSEEVSEKLKKINDAMKANTQLVRDSAKVYHAYVICNANVIKAFIKTPEVRAIIHPTASKVSNAAKSAYDKVESGAKTAKTVANDKVQILKNKMNNLKSRKDQNEEVSESVIYNGKYFSV